MISVISLSGTSTTTSSNKEPKNTGILAAWVAANTASPHTKLIKRREEDTATLKRNKVELEANSGKVEKLRKNLDITTLSIEELNREITKTGALFRRTDPNDPKWKEYQKTLVSLRKRHSETKVF